MDWNGYSAVATCILVILTAYYAVVTHQLLRHAKRESGTQRESIERQLRISQYPHVFASMVTENGSPILVLRNEGTNPAYDVDVTAVSMISTENLDVATFVSKFVSPDHRGSATRDLSSNLIDDTLYGVCHRFVYGAFPPGWKVKIELSMIPVPLDHKVNVQFRDALGSNYARNFWFFPKDGRWRLGDVQPVGDAIVQRIDFTDENQKVLEASPEHICEFADAVAASVRVGHTIWWSNEVEDAGEWTRCHEAV